MGDDLVHGSDVPKTNPSSDMAWTENNEGEEDAEKKPAPVEPNSQRAGADGPAEASDSELTREDIEAAVTHGEIILVTRVDSGARGE